MEITKNNINKVRWGIIGCGAVTEVKSGPAYQNTKNFSLVAVMRRNAELAADYAQRHHVPKSYADADALINDPDVDAIYIATPPDSHFFYALKVANAGKPCCIEKPLSPSYQESLAIVEVFKEKNVPLFSAYYRRSLPRFLHVKEWIDAGEIGQIRHISWCLHKPASEQDLSKNYNWRTDAKVAPGGYFDDLASHGLDLFSFLLGDITEAYGIAVNQLGLYTAKDAVTACWQHANGVTGTGSWNFGCQEREDKVVLWGSGGKIDFSLFNEEDIVLQKGATETRLWIEHPKHVQQCHVENMMAHLLHDIPHPSTGETAAHTSWVMDRILGNVSEPSQPFPFEK